MNTDQFKLFGSLAWRNIWRNRRRTLITLSAIGVGVWSMIALAALMDAWAFSTFQASIDTLTGHGQVHEPGYLDDPSVDHRFQPPQGAFQQQLQSNSVKAWSVRVRVPAIVQSERETAPVTLVGIDPVSERGLSFIANAISEGKYLEDLNSNGILLGSNLAKRLRTGINKRVVIMSQGSEGGIAERGFRVTGIFSAEQEETQSLFAFVSRTHLQKMLAIDTSISEVSFVLHDIETLPEFLDGLREHAPKLSVAAWSELEPFAEAMLDMSTGTIAVWTVVMFILVAFGLVNTLLMAVFERTREFGLLQALGMRPKWILVQVLLESVLLVGIGVVIGVFMGIGTVLYFHDGLSLGMLAEGATMFGAGRVLYPQMNWLQDITIALFVWGMGIVVSLYPAWRAAREVPVETINKSY